MHLSSSCIRASSALAGLLLAAATTACPREVSKPARPNVILITLDTTRADRLSCYGYPLKTSPNIDAMAAAGARFNMAIAQSATTPVSCASQLTGAYPFHHGLRSMHGTRMNLLREDVPTIQGALQKAGYLTAAFVSAFPASSAYGFAHGFDHFDEQFVDQRQPSITSARVVHTKRSQRTAAETNARALPWLRENAQRPFFMWLHYFDPHDPTFKPPKEFLDKFVKTDSRQDRQEHLRQVYDAEILYADHHIGELRAELDKLRIADRTLIIFTADHGEGLGDHEWWGHGILYQEQIRIPLIINGPRIPRGKVVDSLVEHVDMVPTILDYAGVPIEPTWTMDGSSLLPLLASGSSGREKEWGYSESHNIKAFSSDEEKKRRSEMYSLLSREAKIIHYPRDTSADQLYLLTTDPAERDNVIAKKPDVAAAALAMLRSMNAIDGYTPDPSTLSDQHLEHLRSLGYIQ